MVFHSVLNYYKKNLQEKIQQLPHFIISSIEHDSVKLVAEYFQKEGLAGNLSCLEIYLYHFYHFIMLLELTEIPVNQNGAVNVLDVIDNVKPNTILISIMLANNETGVIQVSV